MKQMNKKTGAVLIMLCFNIVTNAQNAFIFKGGIADGWDSKNFFIASTNIFKGGIADGWASAYLPQGPLPVTFLSFTAQKMGKSASLVSWSTSQEINSSRFDIERSNDGFSFGKIGSVTAAGNSSVSVKYSFTDYNPVIGMNYYRLKQIDADGRFVYSPARLVQFDKTDAGTVLYYPNPTSGILTVELSGNNSNEQKVVTITNSAGVVMNQLKLTGTAGSKLTIDLSRYAKGTYFIQVRTPTLNSTERIILL